MMTTCIDDAYGSQLCCFAGRFAVITYLGLCPLKLEYVLLEMVPIERTDQDL